MSKIYACIDLKSFYASVECKERGLDPITTNLVVADNSRTEKTICLAVTPSLKNYGLSGRARLFEVVQKVKEINLERKRKINYRKFKGKTYDNEQLKNNNDLELDYIIASPRMKLYIDYSTRVYNVYLKYLSKDDIYVYSIDEVFCDITNYLKFNNMSARQFVTKIINDVYKTTGITATCGLGTNLYLAKVAMDIVAKHVSQDSNGARIAWLNEKKYREKLWNHKPLTDFWRVGKGYAKKLEKYGINTMGDIARCSINNEDLLYKIFGINAELLIDHAWGFEICTIEDIKKYKPKSNSISSGQVLHKPYDFKEAKLIVKEMIELLSLDLVEKQYVTDQVVLDVIYDIENLTNFQISSKYKGEIVVDYYGRNIPKSAHGTKRLDHKTSSTIILSDSLVKLYDEIVNPVLLIRKINITLCNLISESKIENNLIYEQFNLFSNYEQTDKRRQQERINEKKDKKVQQAMIDIKKKYGKNAILKAMDLEKMATTIERNEQVGGHKG